MVDFRPRAMPGPKFRATALFYPFGLCLLVHPALADTRAFKIDPAHTVVQFEVRQYLGKIIGRLPDVRGTLHLDPDHPENSWAVATCLTRIVDTANRGRRATRRRYGRSQLTWRDSSDCAAHRLVGTHKESGRRRDHSLDGPQ